MNILLWPRIYLVVTLQLPRPNEQDANSPREGQGVECDDDQDGIDPGARQNEERDEEQGAIDQGDDVYVDGGAGLNAKEKVEGAGRSGEVRRIKRGGRRATGRVEVNLGGEEMNLSCDTGSNITIITPEMYKESMGKVVAARRYLRTRGSAEYLDTKGMFKTTVTTATGATKRTWVTWWRGQGRGHASWTTTLSTSVSSATTQKAGHPRRARTRV